MPRPSLHQQSEISEGPTPVRERIENLDFLFPFGILNIALCALYGCVRLCVNPAVTSQKLFLPATTARSITDLPIHLAPESGKQRPLLFFRLGWPFVWLAFAQSDSFCPTKAHAHCQTPPALTCSFLFWWALLNKTSDSIPGLRVVVFLDTALFHWLLG